MTEYVPENLLFEDKEGIRVKRTCWICKHYDGSFFGWCARHMKYIGALRVRKCFCEYFELRDDFSLKGAMREGMRTRAFELQNDY